MIQKLPFNLKRKRYIKGKTPKGVHLSTRPHIYYRERKDGISHISSRAVKVYRKATTTNKGLDLNLRGVDLQLIHCVLLI